MLWNRKTAKHLQAAGCCTKQTTSKEYPHLGKTKMNKNNPFRIIKDLLKISFIQYSVLLERHSQEPFVVCYHFLHIPKEVQFPIFCFGIHEDCE